MKVKNAALLFAAALIWGTAFVAQSVGMEYLGPFGFNGIRNFVGSLALLPCILYRDRRGMGGADLPEKADPKDLWIGGICCGLCLFVAGSLQQVGMQYTSVGKSGFITAFYIVLVPVFGIVLGRKVGWKVWAAVALALAGLYFLCITEGFSLEKGDVYIFLCALVYSGHIMTIDHFAPKTDNVKMSCIQFLVSGVLSVPFMLGLETVTIEAIWKTAGPILYAGVLSSGVAYTLQIIGQRHMNPAVASLILSLESCISVLSGWVFLGETLSYREAAGCVLMFAAIILAQLPEKSGAKCIDNYT